jgi:NAD(P)-dependent dehydrogenase (short-subunit alcohol dehydrogenase family)
MNRGGLAGIGGVLTAGAGLVVLRRANALRRLAELQGQVVLITGGSRGLGLALAHAFGRVGCRVAICGRDGATLERAHAQIAATGVEVFAAPCDVTDQQQVTELVAAVERRFGQIDILVSNAVSQIAVGPLETLTVTDFAAAHAVLYWGVVYPTLAVLPQMRTRGAGRIVTIASLGGKLSEPHLLPYSSAKFAALGFSQGLRAELAGSGITVTTIVPGFLRTGAHRYAQFVGRADDEFAVAVLLELMPLVSMSAERAAQQIVQATAVGAAERHLPLYAAVLARLHGLFPGMMTDLLGGLARRMLPAPPEDTGTRETGRALEGEVRQPLVRMLQAWRGPRLAQLEARRSSC